MPEWISKLVYRSGIALYSTAISAASLVNRKAALLKQGRKNSFAYLTAKTDPTVRYTWFHAASLGEFEQGRPVMEALKQSHPETRILLTFFSPSGYEIRKNYTGADLICYLPADTPANARRLMEKVPLNAAIFIKYEFWAYYLMELNLRNIPVYSIAAIFRKEQLFFKSYGSWYRKLIQRFNTIFVQDAGSLELLLQQGIQQGVVAGDTRFDRVKSLASTAKEFPLIEEFIRGSKKVIIAGSSWPADEHLLAEYQQQHPEIRLMIVPHEIHESHLEGIRKLFPESLRYTQFSTGMETSSNCLVIDTIGMLSSIYRFADIAYIGGGFGVGIHNTLEAAVWGVPVVFGPNYQKFREARELIASGGGFSISNYKELRDCFNHLLTDTTAGEKAGEYVLANTGATSLIIEQLTNDLYAKTIDS